MWGITDGCKTVTLGNWFSMKILSAYVISSSCIVDTSGVRLLQMCVGFACAFRIGEYADISGHQSIATFWVFISKFYRCRTSTLQGKWMTFISWCVVYVMQQKSRGHFRQHLLISNIWWMGGTWVGFWVTVGLKVIRKFSCFRSNHPLINSHVKLCSLEIHALAWHTAASLIDLSFLRLIGVNLSWQPEIPWLMNVSLV